MNIKFPDISLSKSAVKRIRNLLIEKGRMDLKLRVCIYGGGCNGFRYEFTLDDNFNDGDFLVEDSGIALVIDPLSLEYLKGSIIDYEEKLERSRFIVKNPNSRFTCSCGYSFSM